MLLSKKRDLFFCCWKSIPFIRDNPYGDNHKSFINDRVWMWCIGRRNSNPKTLITQWHSKVKIQLSTVDIVFTMQQALERLLSKYVWNILKRHYKCIKICHRHQINKHTYVYDICVFFFLWLSQSCIDYRFWKFA